MKKVLLICLSFAISLSVVAQKPLLKKGASVKNVTKEQSITREPFEKISNPTVKPVPSDQNKPANPNIVTVLDLGTSANVLGYYSGSRTMLVADDDLNCVVNFHRAGPGATPPNLSGYYAMDLGVNMGATQGDWTNQILVTSATLDGGGDYYYDASRYPSAGIYNPNGGTAMAEAYCTFFGPNFANKISDGFGGYTYGNLVDWADTTKHLRWYNPPPYTYIPDGFAISNTQGIAHLTDNDNEIIGTSVYYRDSVIYGRGVWNTTSRDFEYTFKTLAFHCVDTASSADVKIAASPDGNTVYMSVLTNLVGANPLIDSTYFPAIRKSTDGGLTWSEPKGILLGGPNGLPAVKNQYSDYFISIMFDPIPPRDSIPYTTAFDHSLVVDKFGNLHIGVIVGYTNGEYTISTGIDSLLNAFDIYSVDGGETYQAVWLGAIATFRGTFGDYSCDNRMYAARNKEGDKVFFTWNDTRIPDVTDNQNPDVYARGFDLIKNKLTADNGTDAPTNVTFLSDITQEAYWQCTSPIVFTDGGKYTIPIATQFFLDADADAMFKYIPDFSYIDDDFTITVNNPGFVNFSVSPANRNVTSAAGSTTFDVTSNEDWTVTGAASWCTFTQSGTGNGTITVDYQANASDQQRVASFDITAAGLPAQTVTVTQAKSNIGIDETAVNEIGVFPNPSKGIFKLVPAQADGRAMDITVQDVNGRTILQKECKGQKEYTIDLSFATQGIYNLVVRTETSTLTRKLVVLK